MENDQSNLPMETFIHSVASSLTLSTIAYCEKFDANNNFLVIGNGSNLNFFQFLSFFLFTKISFLKREITNGQLFKLFFDFT